MISLKDKVAVVTGAGRGIGRGIAELLARHGAKVVVNDLGTSEGGEGADESVAAQVAGAIKKAGGEAVANQDSVASVEGGEKIIATALNHFGRLDILVNNAGILRDRMIFKMTEQEWDAVINTHLKGTFACTRAATVHMREQKSGRIINMTSTSGLVGNVGQTNYAAAKMGIVGLTRGTALDMARYNVTANCIAPAAWTRLIGTIPGAEDPNNERLKRIKQMSPDLIAPLVVFLASEQAQGVSGQIFGVRGKEIMVFSQPRPVRSISDVEGWTPEKIAAMFAGSLGAALTKLETTGQAFAYEPVV
ncbi:MAG TPA: SDR family NAD(P)-dependent oxidoreductase [Candidatus Binataceae bacterium]|nr:SDR family NAD(P)-dependent oxidoreductase [Candidatus Binataceae bacterium]